MQKNRIEDILMTLLDVMNNNNNYKKDFRFLHYILVAFALSFFAFMISRKYYCCKNLLALVDLSANIL